MRQVRAENCNGYDEEWVELVVLGRPARPEGPLEVSPHFPNKIHHKVLIYKEYHTVCPSSELEFSQALSRQQVCSSPQNRGGHTRLQVRGWKSPNSDDWRKSLALCLICVIHDTEDNLKNLGFVKKKVSNRFSDIQCCTASHPVPIYMCKYNCPWGGGGG